MKLNTKVRYGLRAIIEIYNHNSTTGILQKEISEIQEIPLKYLDSIITGLRRADLIVNYSGKSSGYILAREASEISVYDVYRAFESELTLVNCARPSNDCALADTCSAKDYWCELNSQIRNWMESSSIDQLSKKEQ